MPSRHLLDPDYQPLIDMLAGMGPPKLGEPSRFMQMALANPPPPSELVDRREVNIPGAAGTPEIRALLYDPRSRAQPRPCVLHIHGGGFITGAPEMAAPANLRVAENFGAVVLSVDYRLAPATKHPGAVEDCYAALAWLNANAGRLNIDAGRIGVMGESAGGGLAACLTLLARDRGQYPLAFQHLSAPMLDDRTVDRQAPPSLGQYVWTPDSNRLGWSSLLNEAPGAADVPYTASAARAPDLSCLPPAFINCGALDLFLDENITYAQRLTAAGVPVELHIYPGAPHGFMAATKAAITKQAVRDSMTALGKALRRPSAD